MCIRDRSQDGLALWTAILQHYEEPSRAAAVYSRLYQRVITFHFHTFSGKPLKWLVSFSDRLEALENVSFFIPTRQNLDDSEKLNLFISAIDTGRPDSLILSNTIAMLRMSLRSTGTQMTYAKAFSECLTEAQRAADTPPATLKINSLSGNKKWETDYSARVPYKMFCTLPQEEREMRLTAQARKKAASNTVATPSSTTTTTTAAPSDTTTTATTPTDAATTAATNAHLNAIGQMFISAAAARSVPSVPTEVQAPDDASQALSTLAPTLRDIMSACRIPSTPPTTAGRR